MTTPSSHIYRYTDQRPKVHLLARTKIEPHPFADAHSGVEQGLLKCYQGTDLEIDDLRDGQTLVEFGGRLCYMSFDNPSGRNNDEYIQNIKNQGHYSVFEHGVATFLCENIDRAVTHELIRHRHLSPSELSQRYVDRADAEFVTPPLFRSDPELAKLYKQSVFEAQLNYKKLVDLTEKRHKGLKRKQIREAARRVLPEGIETKIVLTGNYRAWREMLTKRYSVAADASILELAEELLEQLKQLAPSVFGDLELQTY